MEHDSSFVCIARTPDAFDAPVGAPVAACKREIPLELGVCRLMPQAVPGAPRTSVDTMFRLDLTRISYLGGAKALPQWLMNMVLYLVLPFVWRHALKAITDGFSHAERPLAKRVIEDSSGVYGLIRRSTGQSPMLKA
uniref:Uncharacterized protein n=2 Tax=Chrysotila carterae TaxID=13221 RepID=A0A7S4B6J2_CHRCT